MDKILIYTFNAPHQLTYKLINTFNGQVSKYFIGNLDLLKAMVVNNKYDFIMGLGDYRKDVRKIRVEMVFINRYGRQEIIKNGKDKYEANWTLGEKCNTYFSDKPSNGPCNRSAYLLANLINTKKLKTKLVFIHIPKSFSLDEAKKELSGWLNNPKLN